MKPTIFSICLPFILSCGHKEPQPQEEPTQQVAIVDEVNHVDEIVQIKHGDYKDCWVNVHKTFNGYKLTIRLSKDSHYIGKDIYVDALEYKEMTEDNK
jgi:hypothetical protein